MTWQVNWKIWYWPWYDCSFDEDYWMYSHYAGFGPFQFHWYSS